MASERISNTFEGGMKSDLDKRLSKENTFELGVNGRLLYNDNGSLVWENIDGNTQYVKNYDSKYKLIGVCEFHDFVLIFSKYKSGYVKYDEIGYIKFAPASGYGTYYTLHNDTQDTQNLSMNFNLEYPIKAKPFYESDDIIRAYFTDDYNEPRVFTFKKTSNNPLILQRTTDTEFTMNITPNFQMGEIQYRGIVNGSLRSGIYQYSYRLKTLDGYETPWTPVTFPIPVTGIKPPDSSQVGVQETYGMEGVDVIGKTGNRIRITNLDTRYDTIEVAYIHSITETSPKEAGVFYIKDIDKTKTTLDVYHVSVENIVPLNNIDELTDLKDVILKAKTLEVHDNRLWLGNTENKSTYNIPDEVLNNFYVEPEFRALPIDVYANQIYKHQKDGFKPVALFAGNFGSIKRKYERFDGADTYKLDATSQNNPSIGDYYNYQGSLINHSWKGYFRGETYRFAIVFFDKKGYPFFAKHFADVNTPHHTRGYYRGSGNFANLLNYNRVKDDGTTIYKEVEVGNMGGVPTDVNYTYLGHSNGDQRLSSTSCNLERTGGAIENGYHIANNSPTKVGVAQFRPTRCIWNNPNDNTDIGNGSELNTDTWKSSNYKAAYSRILGLRFGGIDLNVVVDDEGTKLKDIIGGVQIVRAERTGADEQVKEQGILLNVHGKANEDRNATEAYDYKERPLYFVNSSPVFNGANVGNFTNERAQHLFRDDFGNEVGYQRQAPYVYSYFGVNGIVAGDWYKLKKGISKIRQDFICDPCNVRSGASENSEWKYLQDGYSGLNIQDRNNLHTPRSYISKNLHTNNVRALSKDSGKRWNECNITHDIFKISSNTNPRSGYGFFDNHIVNTNMWLARTQDEKQRNWIGLSLFQSNDYDGGGLGNSVNDKKWFRAAQASSYLLHTKQPYACAFGTLNNQGGGENYIQHLSVYVSSIVEPNPQPYGGLRNEAIQNTRFHTTGHFLTITDTVLDEIENGGNYILNELEVWGGDCILDAFSFARAYPVIEFDSDCIPEAKGVDADSKETGESRLNWTGKEFREWSHGVIVPIESKYNYRLTYKDNANGVPTFAEVGFATGVGKIGDSGNKMYQPNTNDALYESTVDTCGEKHENFQLQAALSYFDKVRAFATKPIDFVDITDHPNRWHWSNLKQPHNQKVDVMRKFEELSNQDINGNNGEITGSSKLGGSLYSLQSKAFGRLRINERAVTTSDIGDIQLGEGGTMDGVDYISNEFGTTHRDSVISSDKSIYWVDASKRAILRFGGDGLSKISDMKELHTYLQPRLGNLVNKENIINGQGIIATFDFNKNDVYFTVKDIDTAYDAEWKDVGNVSELTRDQHNGNFTLLYNEDMQVFQSIVTAYPTVYFRNGNNLYSSNKTGTGGLYIYNKGTKGLFFDEFFYSYLKFNINYQSRLVKKFDSSIWNVNESSITNIRRVDFTSESLQHRYNDLSDEIVNINGFKTGGLLNRVRYREGLLRFPIRERNSNKSRLAGKSAKIEIWFENSNNKLLSLSNIDTVVRYHSRK
jgi:hypothetical protein